MKKYTSSSSYETERIAEKLAESLTGGEVIAYRGGLGMGKTCFTRGLARGLGFSGDVTSPTFNLVHEYVGWRLALYHFDMYRVTTWEDLDSTGFFDYLESGGVLAAEWSENIEAALPENTIVVAFTQTGEDEREIVIGGKGEMI